MQSPLTQYKWVGCRSDGLSDYDSSGFKILTFNFPGCSLFKQIMTPEFFPFKRFLPSNGTIHNPLKYVKQPVSTNCIAEE